MKIKIFIGSLDIGGAEKQALMLADYLHNRGCAVEVITIYPCTSYKDSAVKPQFLISSLFAKKSNIKIKKILNVFLIPFKLQRTIDNGVTIYSYSDYCNLFAVFSKFFKNRFKLIWGIRRSHVGGVFSSEWKIYLAEKICGLFSSKVDVVIYNSNSAVEYYRQKFSFSINNSYVIHNAVDHTKFKKNIELLKNRNMFGLSESSIVIGVFGRIVEDKGHDCFLRAFAMLKQKYKNLQSLIIGPSNKVLLNKLKYLVAELSIQKDVFFLDARNDMPDMYNMIDIFCSPSLSEGTSNVILEAMASEVPCVVTNVGDSKFVAGTNNIIVEPENELNLSQGMAAMIEQREKWQKIGELNRKRIIENFNLDQNFGKIEKILLAR